MDYELLDVFICEGKHMVTVKIHGNVHVMEKWELKRWFGRLHPEKWEPGNVA